ncbi:MAG: NAD(P)-dependent oxidoreductase [Desulfosarcinaceae bacterium]
MNVLVFGGTGFVGLRVVEMLLDAGDQVRVASRNPWSIADHPGGRLERVAVDIRNYADVVKAFDGMACDTVIHVAYALTAEGENDPHKAAETNVMGTMNIFEAARLNKVRRVVFCSSIAAYAPQASYGDRSVTEDESLMQPSSIYGATKVFNEFMAQRFAKRYAMEIVSVRISAVYGSSRADRGVTAWTSRLVAGAVSGDPVHLAIRPDMKASLIYVDDSAEQLVRLAKVEALQHRVYNSGGATATPGEFAAIVARYCPGARIDFNLEAPLWPYPYQVDGSRLESEVGFHLRTPAKGLLAQVNQERASRGLAPIAGDLSDA